MDANSAPEFLHRDFNLAVLQIEDQEKTRSEMRGIGTNGLAGAACAAPGPAAAVLGAGAPLTSRGC